MWRFALSRRWWAGHVLIVVFCVTFVLLGRWQWDRAHSATGSWQNLGYALQWPLFAVFLIAAWARFLWLEHQHAPSPAGSADPGADRSGDHPAEPDAGQPARAGERAAPVRPAPPAPRTTVEDDPDDELAAYNAYLAQLAEQDRRR